MPPQRARSPLSNAGEWWDTSAAPAASTYPLHRARHNGKPLYGNDHIASPCAHEGEPFAPGADWWEPAVEVTPAPPAPAAAAAAG